MTVESDGAAGARERATLRDLAAETGLSMSTVSQALRGAGRISEATRALVRETSERLAYRANVSARHMRGARTGLVGLVSEVPDAASWGVGDLDFLVRCERAFCELALAQGSYPVLLSGQTAGRAVRSLPVDGIAIIDPRPNDKLLALLDDHAVPSVTLGRDLARVDASEWVVDNDKSAVTREALTGLYRRGMRSVMLVTADTGQNYMTDVVDALGGWAAGHDDVHAHVETLPLPLDSRRVRERVREGCARGVDTVYVSVEAALPDVLAAVVDGGRVPGTDVQVMASSDSTRAQSSHPAVSAIDLNPAALGERLFRLLEARISGADAGTIDRIVPAEIRWRGSTRLLA